MGQDSGGSRPSLAEAVRGAFTADWWSELAQEIKRASKGSHVEVELNCSSCGAANRKRVLTQVPDLPKVISAAKELLEQAEGKPGTADAGQAGLTLVVERYWPGEDRGEGDSGPVELPADG